MKKEIFFALAFFLLSTPVSAGAFDVAVWLPYWHKASGTADLTNNLGAVTQISPFSFEVRSDGTLIDRLRLDEDPWVGIVSSARSQKKLIIPSILWTDAEAMQTILSSPVKRQTHIKEIIRLVESGKFDGIDIDYEGKYARTMPHFSAFLTELGRELNSRKKQLVCTIEARTPETSRFRVVPQDIEYANDYVVIGRVCSQVRIMTYDQKTADIQLTDRKIKFGYYTPVADIDWVRKVMLTTANLIPKNKLLIGVATYGYEYEVTDKRTYYEYKKIRALTYDDAIKLAKDKKVAVVRNLAGELSFSYVADGRTRLVWFSDAEAINDKVHFARALGFAGVAVFRVDGKSDPKIWPVLSGSGKVKRP